MARYPIRVLELRSVRGTGGGPEKTILRGAARSDPQRFAVTVCYLRDRRDRVFALGETAARLGVDYVEVLERHSFDPGIVGPLRRLVRERQIDIVHAHEYKTNLVTLWLARTDGIVPLSTAHGWTGHSARERLLYYPADRRILSRFPRVIAVSEGIRQRLLAAGSRPDRVSTILNGIDSAAFQRQPGRRTAARETWQLPASATVIGSVGRLERQKRFDLLLESFAALRRTRTGLRLVIVGDGSLRGELSETARRLGVDQACTFTGHQTQIADLVQAFDVFVQSSDYEGTPNTVLEAMALETPVVATAVGGTDQLLEDGVHGLLLPPGDASTLAAAIARALDETDATARRVAAARRRIEDVLSFDHRMNAVEGIYEELITLRPAMNHKRLDVVTP